MLILGSPNLIQEAAGKSAHPSVQRRTLCLFLCNVSIYASLEGNTVSITLEWKKIYWGQEEEKEREMEEGMEGERDREKTLWGWRHFCLP